MPWPRPPPIAYSPSPIFSLGLPLPEATDGDPVRHRSQPQRGEFSAAYTVVISGAGRGRLSGCHRDRARQAVVELPAVLCPCPAACLGAHPPRRQTRRHRFGHARQYAGDAGGALRRADGRGRAQHPQHTARRRHSRLYARSCRGQGAHCRSRIFQGDERGVEHRQGKAAHHRLRRPGIHRRRRTSRQDRVRGVVARRRCRLRVADAGRRMGRHHAQLHLRHHRRSEGRRLSPPRRLFAGARQRRHLRHGQVSGLSVDAADVSLQRLVLYLDAVGCRRHSRLPARGARRADLRRHRHSQGHASVRRADRDVDAAQCARTRAQALAARGRVHDRRGAAAGGGACGDEGRRFQRHPSLRTDRDLRARGRSTTGIANGRRCLPRSRP